MKQFEMPKIDVMKLAVEDVITTSEGGGMMPPPPANPSAEEFCI